MTIAQAALSGILLGGLYALMAAGVSVTWGVLRIINLAHFGLILLGSYLTFELASAWNVDPLVTLVVSVPAMFLLGGAAQWAFDYLKISELNSLLVTFGLLIIIVQAVSNIWSADFQRMTATVNPYATGSVHIGRFVFPVPTLLAFAVASIVILGAHLVLRRTFLGRALRAYAEDRPIAAAFGIDHRRIGVLLAAASGATAAIAGALFALANALTPATAFEWFGTVFAVVILGGIGHLVGTLAAGVFVGALSSVVSVVLSPAAAPFVLFSAIVLALLLRPQGLFPVGQRQ
ncbi:branched-chain amino acid ABC transporter permease [Virgisporangium aurantiacum]|uniref:Branched-chain amino acid ABC transporter permease n=1 Tax=Virgisporangium aurantiacum TaxID=175570 RepID=A0A8J3Z4L3_9ACTN|nr:branched-chain amino acid ABC transporter permease [Virgisporangium aurantiacum]GIJ56302.1 branched-chain amino acid ABC transporter permease [Virgisporangium aurantiacum]